MRPSRPTLRRWAGLALVLPPLLAGPPAWAADEILVVRSTAPALPAGTVLAADAPIALPAGSWAILIDDTGRKLRLAGRFEGRPAERFSGPPGASSGAVAALRPLAQTADAGAFAGGLRGGTSGPRRTDPWAISVHDSGAACARGSAVLFWRADPSREAKMTVRLGDGGQRTVVPFAKGQAQIALPASLFAPGQSLKVELDGEPDPARVTLHAVPRSAVSPVDQAVWMATVGCRSQAQTMLDLLS